MTVALSPLSLVRHPTLACSLQPSPASLDELRFALRQCQRRLGTAAEEPTDFDHARELAHAINNHLQREYLMAAVRGAA